MIIFQSTWLQLDISSCSYQSYSVTYSIGSTLLGSAFFTAHRLFLFHITHKTIKSYEKKGYYSLHNYMQCTINTSVCVCSSHPVRGDLMLITVD